MINRTSFHRHQRCAAACHACACVSTTFGNIMASHLSSGRINLGCLRELARKELLQCLLKCHGTKALVWDDQLTGPFGLFAEYSLLKDHDVIKMFTLRPGHLPQVNVQHFIFLTRSCLSLMGIIAENIHNEERNKDVPQKEFHIFFVPRKSFLCDQKLQDLGVYGNFTSIRDINVELYPYDSDLMTMELDAAFRECHLEGDMTSMYHVAKSLMTIQALFGIIPNVYGKGKCAKLVYDLMVRMRRELSGQEPQITSQIDAVMLIDREVDLLSPLITQLTYEGLIDEIFGINSTIVKLPPEKFVKESDGGPSEMPTEPKEFLLNSGDELYTELRRCNFSAVGALLSKKAKAISAQYEERHGAKTVSEIKQFVAKLPHMQAAKQSLTMHTAISELIKEVTDSDDFLDTLHIEHDFVNTIDTEKPHPYIEECIAKQEPLIKVLRLICIQSITNSGLKSKTLDYYKRDILHTYGYEHILTLQNLEAVGLLKLQDQRPYQVLRKALRLTEEVADEQNPNDIAFVHSGYAPLSVRLAQFLARSGWKSIPDALRLLPGPQIEEYQPVPLGLRKRRGSGSSIQSSTEEQKVTLVFFLGGCTYAEIAALRFLSMQEDYPTEYVIATTKVINGKTFIESLMENLEMQSNVAT